MRWRMSRTMGTSRACRLACLLLVVSLSLTLSSCWALWLGAGAAAGAIAVQQYDEARRPCPNCGSSIRREAAACPVCGSRVEPLSSQEALEID